MEKTKEEKEKLIVKQSIKDFAGLTDDQKIQFWQQHCLKTWKDKEAYDYIKNIAEKKGKTKTKKRKMKF